MNVAKIGSLLLITLLTEPSLAASLEERVLTAEGNDLPAVEQEVVHQIQVTPQSAEAHALLSQVLRRRYSLEVGDLYLLRQAGELAQQAIDLDPKDGSGYAALADVLDTMGEPEKALKMIHEAKKRHVPETWHFSYTEARLAADQLATDKALTLLATTLRFSDCPKDAVTPYVVALLQAEHAGEDLVNKLLTWRKNHPSQIFDLSLAIAYADIQKFTAAKKLYEEILRADPKHREALVNLGIIEYRQFNDFHAASRHFEQALAIPGEIPNTARSMILGHLAAAYLKTGDMKRSGATFAKAYQLDSDNKTILAFMSRSFRDRKAFQALHDALSSIRDTTTGTGQLYAILGDTESEGLAKHDQAIHSYMNAILLEPERSDFYTSMGLAYYRKKDYDKALRVFETATDLDPNDAVARYNQACVLALLKRQDEAINKLADALTLDPKLSLTAAGDADFKEIKHLDGFKSLLKSFDSSNTGDLAH